MITKETRKIARDVLKSVPELEIVDIKRTPESLLSIFDKKYPFEKKTDRHAIQILVDDTATLYAATLLHKAHPGLGFDTHMADAMRDIEDSVVALITSPEPSSQKHYVPSEDIVMQQKIEENSPLGEEIAEKIFAALRKAKPPQAFIRR